MNGGASSCEPRTQGYIKQAAAGVPPSRFPKRSGGDTLHIFVPWIGNMNRDVDLVSKRRELFDGRGPLQIASHQQRHATLFLQQ